MKKTSADHFTVFWKYTLFNKLERGENFVMVKMLFFGYKQDRRGCKIAMQALSFEWQFKIISLQGQNLAKVHRFYWNWKVRNIIKKWERLNSVIDRWASPAWLAWQVCAPPPPPNLSGPCLSWKCTSLVQMTIWNSTGLRKRLF